jgi:hypothetical protein
VRYCPSCQTKYADETLRFCLQDGTELREAVTAEMPPEEFGEQETEVSRRPEEPLHIPIHRTGPALVFESTAPPPRPAPPPRSRTGLVVALSALLTMLLLGIVGIGAWLYLKNRQQTVAERPANTAVPTPACPAGQENDEDPA